MSVEDDIYVNGLAVTPTRLALIRLIDKKSGAVHFNPSTKVARNAVSGRRCNADLKTIAAHEWIRLAADDERAEVEKKHPDWIFYRLTDYGRAAIERGRR